MDDHLVKRRRPVGFAVALVVTLLAAEGVARHLGPSLPGSRAGLPSELVDNIARLDAHRDVDTILVGASQLGAGVDPAELDRRSTAVNGAYVFWLSAVGAETLASVMEDVILRHYQPKRLVVGITSREVNTSDLFRKQRDQALLNSTEYRDTVGTLGWLGRLDVEAKRRFALVNHRETLRSPKLLARALRARGNDTVPARDELGMLTDRLDAEQYVDIPEHLAQERRSLHGFTLDEVALSELGALIDLASGQGISVVVVQLPVYEPEYLALTDGLAEGDAEYLAATEQLVLASAATYLDARAAMDWADPTLWADVNHLNRRGNAQLTAWLATALDTPRPTLATSTS